MKTISLSIFSLLLFTCIASIAQDTLLVKDTRNFILKNYELGESKPYSVRDLQSAVAIAVVKIQSNRNASTRSAKPRALKS